MQVVDVFPAGSHAPIVYPVALTSTAKPAAAKFLTYIRGPAGDVTFKRYGFKTLH